MIDKTSLIESTDLVDLISRLTGKTPHKAGREWRCACPIHGGDNPGGFCIFPGKDGKQRWTCFTGSDCGSGDVLDFIKEYLHTDFVGACKYLGGESVAPEEIRKLAELRTAAAAEELKLAQTRMARTLEDLKASKCWETYHDNLDKLNKRELWEKRGIPDEFQNFWSLGYDPEFKLWKKNENGIFETFWVSPTLSIPVFGLNWELETVRHRLLNPPDEGSRYRPERADLGAFPFVADPDNSGGELVIFAEGEAKAARLFVEMDNPKLQVIGMPGKKSLECATPYLTKYARSYVWFDPDADEKAKELAKTLGPESRVIRLGMKSDDAINEGYLDKRGIEHLMRSAVRPEYF